MSNPRAINIPKTIQEQPRKRHVNNDSDTENNSDGTKLKRSIEEIKAYFENSRKPNLTDASEPGAPPEAIQARRKNLLRPTL